MNKRKREDNRLFKKNKPIVYERSNGICELCLTNRAVEVHHIVFRSQLGTSNLHNLACLCRQCHEMAHGIHAKEIRKMLQEYISKKQ